MSFANLLDSFRGMPALVVGDVMLDEYHFGRATRISPEAPVMVIQHLRSAHLPGGAANVALNLKALGAEPVLVGVAGQDRDGDLLEASLQETGMRFHLIRDAGRPTTKKTRIVADHAHQVLRLDFESEGPCTPAVEERLMAAVRDEAARARAVLLSDYLKGVCTKELVQSAIVAAKGAGAPAVANPKPKSLDRYVGASLISLNRSEAEDADLPSEASAVQAFARQKGFDSILVTLGEAGMRAYGSEVFEVPAPKVEVYDTAGAGDTVVATVALGLASVGFKREVFELAAQTAACVVRHVGVATPSAEDLTAIRAL
jgi:D-beta-D-heptose 7-phosphate kinase/D-beta-D-heptose 1-phosphate adenosyltransferase